MSAAEWGGWKYTHSDSQAIEKVLHGSSQRQDRNQDYHALKCTTTKLGETFLDLARAFLTYQIDE